MAKQGFELNKAGVRELLKSEEMMAVCQRYAYTAQSQLGEGYTVNYRTGKTRVNAEVVASSAKARLENSQNNTILKALRGGGND